MQVTYDFDDMMLLPRECTVLSRADCDVSAKLGKFTFKIPLMASNMPTIMNETIAIELAKRNYFYVMHRFGINTFEFAHKMRSLGLYVSIAVGVKEESYKVVSDLKESNLVPEFITIDISHGHNPRVKGMIEHIRANFGNETFVIAGNVTTPQGIKDMEDWGADAIKVGLGPGHACTTSPRTGFGSRGWQLSAVAECAKYATRAVVICDGGVSKSGDIAKAIHMGADWIMSGYLFSGTIEAPGEVVVKDGVKYKPYYGSSSVVAKKVNHRIEGLELLVPCENSLFERLREIEEDLQSSVSFAGGNKLKDLRNVDHVLINSRPQNPHN
ncbi:IMP dehydrogenase / GMP reductase domain protein [Theileria parva strain Muguga]|uniref:GMP reductase n=1 Tax=Theileria parva TaxID=5875 RepID=Q4N8V1_THEPA|nr:IMP dehydrogenase / GMP reductase domain protein [Theileria parva strain Muguga]EAN33607.1 IMP dehydrogenase / GMP reductase domain protein [Theileria parva strain Muguga]|eukprot:XP_765890.1 guanosine monophosphate reductase [Theileria parva strain Muguga]